MLQNCSHGFCAHCIGQLIVFALTPVCESGSVSNAGAAAAMRACRCPTCAAPLNQREMRAYLRRYFGERGELAEANHVRFRHALRKARTLSSKRRRRMRAHRRARRRHRCLLRTLERSTPIRPGRADSTLSTARIAPPRSRRPAAVRTCAVAHAVITLDGIVCRSHARAEATTRHEAIPSTRGVSILVSKTFRLSTGSHTLLRNLSF